MNNTIGKNLEKLIDNKGISRVELAKKVGVSPATITFWCRDECQIRDKYYSPLCKALNCNIYDLILGCDTQTNPIPILGTICAGNGIICEEDYQGFFYADQSIKADYCLKVKGNSMSPVIKNGGIAFIEKDYQFENGDVYAVIISDEVMLKKISTENGMYCLTSINPDYKPIYVKDLFIVGKCIGYYSSLS